MLNILLNININGEVVLIVSCIILLVILLTVIFTIIKSKRKEDKEIDSIISNMVQERKEPKEEVEVVDDKTKELEDVLEKMQKDLEAKPVDVVANFEKEQEEKAIISYSELVKTLKKNQPEEEKTIDILVDEIKEAANANELTETAYDKKFKNTDFISPVYGKMEEHLDYPKVSSFKKEEDINEYLENFDKQINNYKLEDYLEEFNDNKKIDSLEQTLDMEPISFEIKKNEDFLQALKEFRENL